MKHPAWTACFPYSRSRVRQNAGLLAHPAFWRTRLRITSSPQSPPPSPPAASTAPRQTCRVGEGFAEPTIRYVVVRVSMVGSAEPPPTLQDTTHRHHGARIPSKQAPRNPPFAMSLSACPWWVPQSLHPPYKTPRIAIVVHARRVHHDGGKQTGGESLFTTPPPASRSLPASAAKIPARLNT